MKRSIKRIVAPLAVATVIVLAACSTTLKVTSDYDKSKDFTPLKTYAFYDNITTSPTISQLNRDRLIAGVRSALNAKGYTETSSNPSFMVNINAVMKNEKSVSANTDYYGYGGMYRPYGYWGAGGMMGSSTTTFDVQNYQDGSIIVDMVDPQTKKLFWEGVGNAEIDGQFTDPDQKISTAMTKILASFPNAGLAPGAKK